MINFSAFFSIFTSLAPSNLQHIFPNVEELTFNTPSSTVAHFVLIFLFWPTLFNSCFQASIIFFQNKKQRTHTKNGQSFFLVG